MVCQSQEKTEPVVSHFRSVPSSPSLQGSYAHDPPPANRPTEPEALELTWASSSPSTLTPFSHDFWTTGSQGTEAPIVSSSLHVGPGTVPGTHLLQEWMTARHWVQTPRAHTLPLPLPPQSSLFIHPHPQQTSKARTPLMATLNIKHGLLTLLYSKSSTYKEVPFQKNVRKSNIVGPIHSFKTIPKSRKITALPTMV